MNGWVVRQVIRAAGEILLTAGVVGLLFLGYLVWGTGLRAASVQRAFGPAVAVHPDPGHRARPAQRQPRARAGHPVAWAARQLRRRGPPGDGGQPVLVAALDEGR